MQAGEACIDFRRTGTTWDYTRQRDNPRTVLDSGGQACADPDDERTCPKARRCVEGAGCFTDTPDWSDPALLADPVLGWGDRALPFLDPTVETSWTYTGDDYEWTSVSWGIVPGKTDPDAEP